jgi:hypothetical protein
MQNPPPPTPELKALLARLRAKTPPAKALRVRAKVLTADIIAQIQRQSRLKK